MAAGDAIVVQDTSQELIAISHTAEITVPLANATLPIEQGEWVGQFTAPNITTPKTAHWLFGYSDFLRAAGLTRSGSLAQFRAGPFNLGDLGGVTSWGYQRLSAGAQNGARHGLFMGNLVASAAVQMRIGTVFNSSDRFGQWVRSTGDPRGFWAVELPNNDFINTSLTGTIVGTGRYGDTPRAIDLGTPSPLSEGTFRAVDALLTDDSLGTTITRSGGSFTVAANSKVLCASTFQFLGDANRRCGLVRMDVDGVPYAWTSVYMRNSSSDRSVGSIAMPVVTGASPQVVSFSFVEQAGLSGVVADLLDANIRFFDLSDADVAILGKTDADVLAPSQISFPTADEVALDPSFDHPAANLTQLVNDTGGEITVLVGLHAVFDRSVTTNTVRKQPAGRIRQDGAILSYFIAGEYSRGSAGGGSAYTAGFSYCAPVVMPAGGNVEFNWFDMAGESTNNLVINSTDGAAVYLWAIRLDTLATCHVIEEACGPVKRNVVEAAGDAQRNVLEAAGDAQQNVTEAAGNAQRNVNEDCGRVSAGKDCS